MYLRNCWYVAAWDHEILGDTLLARTLLDEALIFYRCSDGTVVAMQDRCCHRHAPLHLGRKEGDCVRCMYHGLRYDATGACVEVPGQERISPKLRQRVYPVVEQKRWVWIWMGDPELADPLLIPDTFSLQHPQWRWKPNYLHYKCNHMLIADNLLDFSHLSYVHEATFGGSSNVAEAQPTVTRGKRSVKVSRPVRNTVPAPYHQRLGHFEGAVNRWFDYEFYAPGVLLLDAGVKPAQSPDDDLSEALRFHSCQAITPETTGTTHYFFMQAHNFRLDDAVVTESIEKSQIAAFEEDKRVLEAQQRMIDISPGQPMVGIAADGGLMQYRRLVEELLKLERPVINIAVAA